MAIVVVAADNARIDPMDDTTYTTNIGGGPGEGQEPDVVYQGIYSVSRKVGTSILGFYTSGGSTFDLTAARRKTVMFKAAIANWNALEPQSGPGLRLLVGSGSGTNPTDLYQYDVSLPEIYPARGGFIIRPIDPNVSGYRDGTLGTPSLSAAQLFGIQADFTATSISPNVIVDAVDYGAGLNLTNGDGGSTDGVFQDFVDYDEGTSTNRFGYVTTADGIIYIYGKLWIGQNTSQASVITEFTDSSKVLVFPDGLFDAGFSAIGIDLGNASTSINITNCVFSGRGTETTVDTRPILDIIGTSGSATLSSCSFDAFASFALTSATTFTNNVITNSGAIDVGAGADLTSTSISDSTVAIDSSALIWDANSDPNGELDEMIISKGANAHHAIEFGLTSPLEMTLTGIDFSGFNASNGQNDSTFHIKRTSGTVTINVNGGSGNASYKTDGATVIIVPSAVTTTITVKDATDFTVIENARVILSAADGTGDLNYQESVTITSSATTANVTHTTHGLATNDWVLIEGANEEPYNGSYQITVTGANNYTYTMTDTAASPATGTITSTTMIFNELSNASGIVDDTRAFSVDQNVVGRVRKSSGTPFYKNSPVTATIDSATGLTLTVLLIPDE